LGVVEMSIFWCQFTTVFLRRPVKFAWKIVHSLERMGEGGKIGIRCVLIKDRCYALCLPPLPTVRSHFGIRMAPAFFKNIRKIGSVLPDHPGNRKPRSLAVDECANFWPGCRPARALVRATGFARGAPLHNPDFLNSFASST
jgi:hypothetical protein